MSQDKTRLRKCLSAMKVQREGKLVSSDQRKSYFICLKMLGILPPPPKSDFVNWKFYTPARLTNKKTILYTPKCLHDVLISSHATSCEHGTIYFGYYHRHQMILLEVFLNLAHQILKGGEKVLNTIYPNNIEIYNEGNRLIWDEVFREYQQFAKIPEVSNHYWNPTDFASSENLSIPEQLDWDRDGKDLDNIDNLYFSINNCYPWEINVIRRWYNSQQDYKEDIDGKDGFKNSQIFNNYFKGYQTTTRYKQNQLDFLNGESNPHDNSNKLPIKDISDLVQKTQQISGQESYRLFQKDKGILRLCPISKAQSLVNYGAKSKNAAYIQISQIGKAAITEDYRSSYNRLLPHVWYASSLNPKLKFKQFLLGSGFEMSHGQMHNNFGPIMMNPTFSITSLIFFPYHSWIDAQLQIKIRQANTLNEFNDLKVTLTQKYSTQSRQLRGVLHNIFEKLGNNPNQSMKNVAQFGLSGLKVDKNTAGYYPIFQWITPPFLHRSALLIEDISQISAAFLSQDYIVTNKLKIRDSTTLYEAYQKYFQYYQARFYFFADLQKFNPSFKFTPNYNYQVGSSPKDIDTELASDASNFPQYLKEVLNDLIPIDNIKEQARQQIMAEDAQKDKTEKPILLKATGSPQVQSVKIKQDPAIDEQTEEEQRLQLRKVLQSSIQLFASYPVNSPNQTLQIIVRPNNIIELLQEIIKNNLNFSKAEYAELQRFIKDGISIDDILIFGKANFADVCPRCKDHKVVYRSLGDRLRNASPQIWKYIHTKTLNKVLFNSKIPQPINCIYQRLQLIPNANLTDYRLVRGAEEIHINIINQAGKGTKFVRIEAESYSVQKNSLQSVLTKKYKNFKTQFDFFKIFDVNQERDSNYFDHYVYKHVKGTFIINEVAAQFSFDIPTFQRLLRLNITVSAERNNLGQVTTVNLVIEDRDYHKKLRFYEISYELLDDIFENGKAIDFQQ